MMARSSQPDPSMEALSNGWKRRHGSQNFLYIIIIKFVDGFYS